VTPRRTFVVAIDGPAASGKSALGSRLARRLGFAYLDTGLLYRAMTALALTRGMPTGDAARLSALAAAVRFEVRPADGSTNPDRLWIDGVPATDALQTPEVDAHVSAVSAHPGVRAALLNHQRALAERADTVMVGRDIGTVVLPDADLKLYLVASPEVRAQRRWADLVARGVDAHFGRILDDLIERDARDSRRAIAPLKAAADAVILPTDRMTLDGEVELAGRLVDAARRLR
jgi:cytidylate kinase